MTGTTTPTATTPSAAEMMKSVKSAWDKAPAGSKKDAALKFYQTAEAAMKANDDKACMAALKQAETALH